MISCNSAHFSELTPGNVMVQPISSRIRQRAMDNPLWESSPVRPPTSLSYKRNQLIGAHVSHVNFPDAHNLKGARDNG